MNNYKLLSDAIIDGSRLAEQGFGQLLNSQGHTCALGAASQAISGDAQEGYDLDRGTFASTLDVKTSCPVPDCSYPASCTIITIQHLNDDHLWSRERIAGFVATVEEKLGLCEIISDDPERHSTSGVAESAQPHELPELAFVSTLLS